MEYIAIDIGASSGRLMHATHFRGRKFEIEEIHRFKNSFSNIEGTDYWDISHLINEILIGLEKVKKKGIEECYVGIDTWGVDYCLIGKNGQRLGAPVSYRDSRTEHAVSEFQKKMSLSELYRRTGIQIQSFNTIFQLLMEDKKKLKEAEQLLLIPDYLGYVFTGKSVIEKTNASTMQLLNIETQDWDEKILEVLEINKQIFPKLVDEGTILGELLNKNFPQYQLPKATFICVASHDTASAVVGTPAIGENWAYISSGTWSLMGIETAEFYVNEESYESNFTNEYGAAGTVRFLKNIMGMWLIQEVARMQNYQYSYAELAQMASQEVPFQQFIDVNDPRFLNPENMITEIQNYCQETNQKIPKTPGEIARCVYDNLALSYGLDIRKIEKISGHKVEKIHIIGGGSNNQLLNQMTADICKVPVEAGPSEATAIGNLLIQMVATGIYPNIELARYDVSKSLDKKIFISRDIEAVSHTLNEYEKFIERNLEEING